LATGMKSVALIGVGMVSGTYLSALKDLRGKIELKGVLGSKPDSGQRFIQANALHSQTVQAYESVQQLADDSSVDFILLTTPPNARLELVESLSLAGKPILTEKPIERTLAAATQLCQITETANLPFGVMLQHRARPSVAQLFEKQKNSAFGPLLAVEISVPWWREQSYYDEPGRGTYARDGGGVLISQAIHTLDLALQFTGPVQSVNALSATTKFHSMESEDFVSAGLQFNNGAVGNLFASTSCYPGRTESIFLHYRSVSVRLESNLLELSWQDGRTENLGETSASGSGADPMAFTSDWHRFMIENFAATLNGDATLIASGRSALQVHALIEALEASAKSGSKVDIHDR